MKPTKSDSLRPCSLRLCSLLLCALPLAGVATARAEVLVDFGWSSTQIKADIANAASIAQTTASGYHVGAGVRRALKQGSIGVRLELEDVDSNQLIAVRALDYKHAFSERLPCKTSAASAGRSAGACRRRRA